MEIAVVTGTSTGIGAAIARLLLARGWEVAGIARRNPGIEDSRYRHLAADLQDAPAAAAAIESRFGELLGDPRWRRVGLVNNAASAAATGPVQRLDAAELVRVYSVNVAIPLWLMGLVARRSPREAAIRIVNLSSGAAVRAAPGLAAYCSSKAALRMAGMVFGAELDSLSDFVSFGVAPAIMVYLWTMQAAGGLGWALALLFSVCCALRLARFNIKAGESDLPPWATCIAVLLAYIVSIPFAVHSFRRLQKAAEEIQSQGLHGAKPETRGADAAE